MNSSRISTPANNKTVWQLVLVAMAAVLLTACGGGASPSSLTQNADVEMRSVRGAVVKAPVGGAVVEFFAMDFVGQPILPALASVTTAVDGSFSVPAVAAGLNLLVRSRGGSYHDESDSTGQRQITLGANEGFETLLPAGETSLTLNPYTQALVDRLRAQALRDDVPMESLIAGGRSLFQQAFGFDILTTIPTSPAAPASGSTADQINYAMALGGVANAINKQVVAAGSPTLLFQFIRNFANDFQDGVIEQEGSSNPLNLNDEIARFRNNNDPHTVVSTRL